MVVIDRIKEGGHKLAKGRHQELQTLQIPSPQLLIFSELLIRSGVYFVACDGPKKTTNFTI